MVTNLRLSSGITLGSDCQMTCKGLNLDSNLNSAAWPTCNGLYGVYLLWNPRIKFNKLCGVWILLWTPKLRTVVTSGELIPALIHQTVIIVSGLDIQPEQSLNEHSASKKAIPSCNLWRVIYCFLQLSDTNLWLNGEGEFQRVYLDSILAAGCWNFFCSSLAILLGIEPISALTLTLLNFILLCSFKRCPSLI